MGYRWDVTVRTSIPSLLQYDHVFSTQSLRATWTLKVTIQTFSPNTPAGEEASASSFGLHKAKAQVWTESGGGQTDGGW